jgi:Flp pilus assembly protein TadD
MALADALALTGDRERAKEVESKIIERGAAEDPRSFSLYLATRGEDVGQAIHLAQLELTMRGDVFTHDALAWALAKAGRAREAQMHVTEALSEGTVDARLFLHAGIIAALNNDNTQAKRLLQRASSNPANASASERTLLEAWREKPTLRDLCVLCVSAVKNKGKPQRRRGRRGHAELKSPKTQGVT